MPTTVGSHSVAAFVNPSNGDALDATVVKGNDNTLRAAYVTHDADAGVHFQSSVLASRPAAGVAGRKWLTTDDGPKLWYDTGSVWTEIGYVPTTGTAVVSALQVTGALEVDGTTLTVDATNNRVGVGTATPGVALDVVGTTRTSNGLTVTAGGLIVSAGGMAVTGNSTVTGTLSGLTGLTVASGGLTVTGNSTITGTLGGITTLTATTFSGSGASLTNLDAGALASGTVPDARFPATLPAAVTASSLTSVGTLTGLTMGGTVAMADNVLERPVIKDYGETRTTPSISAGTLTLNLENGNVFGVSLNANITTLTISNPSASGTACSFTLAFTADGTLRSVTWPGAVKWPGGVAPILTSTNGKVDIFTFVTWDAGANWYAFVAGQNF